MQVIWEEYQTEEVMVLSIGLGVDSDGAAQWRSDFGQTCPVLADPNGASFSRYSMGYVPHNAVIDENMVIQFTDYGFVENPLRTLLTNLSLPLVKIGHEPLRNTENYQVDFTVDCTVRSGGHIVPESVLLNWNTDGSMSFTSVQMTNTADINYQAMIPAQSWGTTVYYYIHAEADNGYQNNSPFAAPQELNMFKIFDDQTPPVIAHDPILTWRADMFPPVIEADVTDELYIADVAMEYKKNDGSVTSVPMTDDGSGHYSATFDVTVLAGDMISYRIKATDTAIAQNVAYDPASDYYQMNIIDPMEALVLDLDGNTNSGPEIQSTLISLGYDVDYVTSLPQQPYLYKNLFICLGVQPDNHVLTGAESDLLMTHLDAGGNAYMEGGNVWSNDLRTDFIIAFNTGAKADGAADTGTLVGQTGAFTEGMTFQYTGDNQNMDHLRVKAGAVKLFENESPNYVSGVANDSGTFRTVSSSYEFGGLEDGTSTKADLMQAYADYFGMTVAPTPTPEPSPTPSSCGETGVTLWMPSKDFGPDDPCSCSVTVCNGGTEKLEDMPLFVILDVAGLMFFWPDFDDFAYQNVTLEPGKDDVITVLSEFSWPAGVGSFNDTVWYAGMTNPEMTVLKGAFDMWEFGWHE